MPGKPGRDATMLLGCSRLCRPGFLLRAGFFSGTRLSRRTGRLGDNEVICHARLVRCHTLVRRHRLVSHARSDGHAVLAGSLLVQRGD
jgi:hypothetical protein